MGYETCPYCGANLDAGEKCDCREEEDTALQSKEIHGTDRNRSEAV